MIDHDDYDDDDDDVRGNLKFKVTVCPPPILNIQIAAAH